MPDMNEVRRWMVEAANRRKENGINNNFTFYDFDSDHDDIFVKSVVQKFGLENLNGRSYLLSPFVLRENEIVMRESPFTIISKSFKSFIYYINHSYCRLPLKMLLKGLKEDPLELVSDKIHEAEMRFEQKYINYIYGTMYNENYYRDMIKHIRNSIKLSNMCYISALELQLSK